MNFALLLMSPIFSYTARSLMSRFALSLCDSSVVNCCLSHSSTSFLCILSPNCFPECDHSHSLYSIFLWMLICGLCLPSSPADPVGCRLGCVLLLPGSLLHSLLSTEEECFFGGQRGHFHISFCWEGDDDIDSISMHPACQAAVWRAGWGRVGIPILQKQLVSLWGWLHCSAL